MNLTDDKLDGVHLIVRGLRRILFDRRLITFFVVVITWQFLTWVIDIDLFPTPMGVVESIGEALQGGLFLSSLGDSMVRIVLGFGLGLLAGIAIGLLMGSRAFWNRFFQDLIVLGLSLPGLVYALLAIMVLGIGLAAPVAAIALASLPFVAVNVREGVKSVDKQLLDMCRVYRIERARLIWRVIIPTLMPFIMAAVRIGFTVAWKVAVLTEVFGASTGIGYQMRYQFGIFSVRGIVAWAFLFGVVMLVLEYGGLVPLERYVGRWRPKVEKVI